jgi:hypothetical protein
MVINFVFKDKVFMALFYFFFIPTDDTTNPYAAVRQVSAAIVEPLKVDPKNGGWDNFS